MPSALTRTSEIDPIRLRTLQNHLERIYEVRTPHDVEEFLVTDPALADRIQPSASPCAGEERLLVAQCGDDLEVCLFVHRDVVDRLASDSPSRQLHDGNLADFCTALEGVSHFVYLTWNAHHRRQVSLLEMEVQAEVDKWIACALLLGRQRRGRIPALLRRRLFDDSRFDDQLEPEHLDRYRRASFYAGKYCTGLETRYLRGNPAPGLMNELRRFYRLGQQEKFTRIDRHHRPH